jgi:hypothetical protein
MAVNTVAGPHPFNGIKGSGVAGAAAVAMDFSQIVGVAPVAVDINLENGAGIIMAAVLENLDCAG